MRYERPGTWPNPAYVTPAPRRKTWGTPRMEEFAFRFVSDEELLAVATDYTRRLFECDMAAEVLRRRTIATVRP